MSERREISEADAVRMLYLKQVQETIRLRRQIIDRDFQNLEKDRVMAEKATAELFDRIGMADGERLEEDEGKYYIVPPVRPVAPQIKIPPGYVPPVLPELKPKTLVPPGNALPAAEPNPEKSEVPVTTKASMDPPGGAPAADESPEEDAGE